jgi:hypothetical protein
MWWRLSHVSPACLGTSQPACKPAEGPPSTSALSTRPEQLLRAAATAPRSWSQHVFVDGQQPRDAYRLTYNCAGVSRPGVCACCDETPASSILPAVAPGRSCGLLCRRTTSIAHDSTLFPSPSSRSCRHPAATGRLLPSVPLRQLAASGRVELSLP